MNHLYPITVDFETHYTDKAHGGYSLSSMTAEEYIRDPRFQIIGFSMKPAAGPSTWYTSRDLGQLRAWAGQYDWSRCAMIGHNSAELDNLIMTEVLGQSPAGFIDTCQLARATGNGRDSASLDALTKRYGLTAKGQQVKRYINYRLEDFSPHELQDYGNYCGNSIADPTGGDSDRTWELFCIFNKLLPMMEFELADMCAKMFAYPSIQLDEPLLRQMQIDMGFRKQQLMARVGDILGVNPALQGEARTLETQRLLRKDAVLAEVFSKRYDIEPPTKLSPKQTNPDGTPKRVYAFAKTDEGMEALLEFEDESDPEGAEDIQALAAARLSVKSTIAESRVNRFHGISQRGKLPAAIAFGKTHTHRLAGAQKINLQNMSGSRPVTAKTPLGTLIHTPRGIERLYRFNDLTQQVMVPDGTIFDLKGGEVWVAGLRDCLVAPPGYKLVVVDSSQIELRICHMIAGQLDTVEDLRAGVDVYSSFASSVYHRPITKADKKERQHGKVGMLQLQYQAGADSFRRAARVMGGVRLTEDQALGTVQTYRSRFTEVVRFWRRCQQGIETMARGGGRYLDQWGLLRLEHNRICLDGFAPLTYHNLRQELMSFDNREPEMQWCYDDKEKRYAKKTYGGSVTENICQWLGRNVVLPQTLQLEKRWGNFRRDGEGVVLSVHDEAVLCVREHKAHDCLADSLNEFGTPPAWWPQLPVAAEGGIGQRYSECK